MMQIRKRDYTVAIFSHTWTMDSAGSPSEGVMVPDTKHDPFIRIEDEVEGQVKEYRKGSSQVQVTWLQSAHFDSRLEQTTMTLTAVVEAWDEEYVEHMT